MNRARLAILFLFVALVQFLPSIANAQASYMSPSANPVVISSGTTGPVDIFFYANPEGGVTFTLSVNSGTEEYFNHATNYSENPDFSGYLPTFTVTLGNTYTFRMYGYDPGTDEFDVLLDTITIYTTT